MENDSVDGIVQAWRRRDPQLDSSSLEVVGRLLLLASYCERAAIGVLDPFGLSIADFDVLNTLRRVADRRGCTPTELARASLVTTGAMTSRLDRLERSELIRRTPDPADRRGVRIHLTSRGTKVARQALHDVIAANRAFLQPLSAAQQRSLAGSLKALLLPQEA